ncbi:MAG: eukaryotic-like serine/threonine-protein kinase [Frankiaceae bacterium]|nr:eukaryotic-like serine/threonine-protein kinase [Frankiaceae bacterium]
MISLRPSVVLGDRYRLESRIASGGMGEVWAARDIVLERPVAVKVLRPEFAEDSTFRTRFLAEARHSALLSHAGIAGVFDFGEAEGTPYIVMELVEGETLATLLARRGALPVGEALSIVGQAALALQAAHDAGVVHRDVKPGNFIVRPDGVVKVTDVGIARALAGASVTMTGNVLGTVHYIAPEQARGERVTPASDTYALGVVAWECLEGHRPFPFDSPVAIATAHASEPLPPLGRHVPPAVRELVASATAKDPAQRPLTAGDFGRRALALAAGLAGGAAVDARTADAADTVLLPMAALTEPSADRTRVMPIMSDRPPSAAMPVRQGHGGRWRLLFVLLIIAAIVAVALLWRPTSRTSTNNPVRPTATRSATRASTAAVALSRSDYVGRPYAEVAAALSAKGLTAKRQDSHSAAAPDTVVDIGNGPYQRNDVVTVTVSTGPAAPSSASNSAPVKNDPGKHKKGK